MVDTPKRRRSRRQFDDDSKAQAVRMVLDEGKSIGAVSRDLDLTESAELVAVLLLVMALSLITGLL